MSILSERFMQIVNARNLTVRMVAEDTGFSRSTVHRYLSGEQEKVPLSFVQAFARAYDVDVAYLVGWTDDPVEVDPNKENDEIWELREQLRRPEMRTLFMASKHATKEDLLRTVQIIEALKKASEYGNDAE